MKVNDNVISLPNGVARRDDTGYNPSIWWESGNVFLNYIWNTEDPQKYEKIKVYNASLRKHPLLKFSFNPENVKAEVAAVISANAEYISLLGSGAGDTETYLKLMLEKLNIAGYDKIISEIQSQYDDWKAAK